MQTLGIGREGKLPTKRFPRDVPFNHIRSPFFIEMCKVVAVGGLFIQVALICNPPCERATRGGEVCAEGTFAYQEKVEETWM